MLFLLGMVLAALMLVAGLWSAYLLAIRLLGDAPTHARLAAAALVALWLSVAAFGLLAGLRLFRLEIAAPLWIVGALAAHRLLDGDAARRTLLDDLRAAAGALRRLFASPFRLPVALAGLGLIGLRLVRDLVSPPMAWDSLTYHLFRPARWIQEGALSSSIGPDSWRFLEYFPHAGDVPWAWAMLPVRGDALIAPTGVLVLAACVLGGYALARSLGAARIGAGLAAMAIGSLPAAVNEATSGYADNVVLAAFLLAGAAIAALAQRPSPGRAALAGGGLGLVAAAKLSGLPALIVGLLFVAWLVLRRREEAPAISGRSALLAAVASASAVALPGYLRALVETGSPFYPLTVSIAGHTLFAGNRELTMLYEGRLHDLSGYDASAQALFRALALPAGDPLHEHLGFGYGFLALLPLGALGLAFTLRRDPDRRAVALFLVAAALLPVIGLASPAFLAHRTIWQRAIGRLLTALPATAAVFGARFEGRAARAVWLSIVIAGELSCVPLGTGALALEGMRRLALPLAVAAICALLAALAMHARARRPLTALALIAPLFAALVALPLDRVRAELRYPLYAAHAGSSPAFQMHTLEPSYASSFPIWRALDDGAPHRIALAAGWDGIGHNWFRYPLTGSRLQNHVDYVPVSRDGEVFDYMHDDEVDERGVLDAWLARLVAQHIDTLVTLHPSTIEDRWAGAHPALFEPMAKSTEGWNVAYRFHPERVGEDRRAGR